MMHNIDYMASNYQVSHNPATMIGIREATKFNALQNAKNKEHNSRLTSFTPRDLALKQEAIVKNANMKAEDMIKKQEKIQKMKNRARSVLAGQETYCGHLKESPISPKFKLKAPPPRLITLDGIMQVGQSESRAISPNSKIIYGQAKTESQDTLVQR